MDIHKTTKKVNQRLSRPIASLETSFGEFVVGSLTRERKVRAFLWKSFKLEAKHPPPRNRVVGRDGTERDQMVLLRPTSSASNLTGSRWKNVMTFVCKDLVSGR
jgi:hypothetical protein